VDRAFQPAAWGHEPEQDRGDDDGEFEIEDFDAAGMGGLGTGDQDVIDERSDSDASLEHPPSTCPALSTLATGAAKGLGLINLPESVPTPTSPDPGN
jgi:hypothetical protein